MLRTYVEITERPRIGGNSWQFFQQPAFQNLLTTEDLATMRDLEAASPRNGGIWSLTGRSDVRQAVIQHDAVNFLSHPHCVVSFSHMFMPSESNGAYSLQHLIHAAEDVSLPHQISRSRPVPLEEIHGIEPILNENRLIHNMIEDTRHNGYCQQHGVGRAREWGVRRFITGQTLLTGHHLVLDWSQRERWRELMELSLRERLPRIMQEYTGREWHLNDNGMLYTECLSEKDAQTLKETVMESFEFFPMATDGKYAYMNVRQLDLPAMEDQAHMDFTNSNLRALKILQRCTPGAAVIRRNEEGNFEIETSSSVPEFFFKSLGVQFEKVDATRTLIEDETDTMGFPMYKITHRWELEGHTLQRAAPIIEQALEWQEKGVSLTEFASFVRLGKDDIPQANMRAVELYARAKSLGITLDDLAYLHCVPTHQPSELEELIARLEKDNEVNDANFLFREKGWRIRDSIKQHPHLQTIHDVAFNLDKLDSPLITKAIEWKRGATTLEALEDLSGNEWIYDPSRHEAMLFVSSRHEAEAVIDHLTCSGVGLSHAMLQPDLQGSGDDAQWCVTFNNTHANAQQLIGVHARFYSDQPPVRHLLEMITGKTLGITFDSPDMAFYYIQGQTSEERALHPDVLKIMQSIGIQMIDAYDDVSSDPLALASPDHFSFIEKRSCNEKAFEISTVHHLMAERGISTKTIAKCMDAGFTTHDLHHIAILNPDTDGELLLHNAQVLARKGFTLDQIASTAATYQEFTPPSSSPNGRPRKQTRRHKP